MMASRTSRWRKKIRYAHNILDSACEVSHNFDNNSVVIDNSTDFDETVELPNASFLSSSSSLESSDTFSSIEFPSANEVSTSLSEDLAEWACLRRVPIGTVTQLLKILKAHMPSTSLPSDGRTLLRTPCQTFIEFKCGGQYLYLGLSKGICRKLEKTMKIENINLFVNVDGLPLFKSSPTQLWPILCSIENVSTPFVVALFCGENKPNDESEFLKDFLEEYANLRDNGILINNKRFSVQFKFFCCDAPARQFLKSIKGHTGYNCCERCCVEGTRAGNTTVFLDIDAPARQWNSFNLQLYEEHQLKKCSLSLFGFNCINNFVLDYMHLVCLGVVKRTLSYLCIKDGTKKCKIPQASISEISSRLEAMALLFPSDFSRKPRGLCHMKRWKATEFKHFLLYTGVVALNGILGKEKYTHLLALSVAISILLYYERTQDYYEKVNYARDLIRWYVSKCPEYYGESFVSYNVHNLLHIHEDVIHHQMGLQEMSAFTFENHMQVMKKYIRNSRSPLSQISNRLNEIDQIEGDYYTQPTKFKISANNKDGWFLTEKFYCRVININQSDVECDTVKIRNTRSYFETPCDSKILDIGFLPNSLKRKRKVIPNKNLLKKVVCIADGNGFVMIPLNHKFDRV